MKYVGKNGLKVGNNEVWHEGNLEVGGRNLLISSTLDRMAERFTKNTTRHLKARINYYFNFITDLEPNTTYTISNKEIIHDGSGGRPENTLRVTIYNEAVTSQKQAVGILISGESLTFTTLPSVVTGDKLLFYPTGSTYIDFEVFELKLEKGNKATDWTPAPEDIQEQIDDKADKSQVKTDVPANAKFTDTTYTEISESEINTGTASTLRTITARRIKYILDKVQGWINALTKADVGLGNVTNDKQATKTEFDSHNSDTTKHITSTERTSWNGKWAYNENTIKAVKVNNAGNADTVNGKTVAENVPAGAKFTDTVYTHPTTAGNKHIPAGGASGQFLKWSANGTAVWGSVPGGLALGETSGTAYRGDRGKVAYDHSQNAAVHIKTVTSATEPSNLNAGDQWHKEY